MAFKLRSSDPTNPGKKSMDIKQSKFEAYIEKRNVLQKSVNEEKSRIESIKRNAGSIMKDLYEQDQSGDLTDSGDLPSSELYSDSLYNWMQGDANRNACNTFSCSVMKEAGVTVPDSVGPDGIVINNRTYRPGDPMPIIPGNEQFDYLSSQLGFEMQPVGTAPTEAMDLIRESRYFYPEAGFTDTAHSVLSGGVKNDDPDGDGVANTYYNPGPIEEGVRSQREAYSHPDYFNVEKGKNYNIRDSAEYDNATYSYAKDFDDPQERANFIKEQREQKDFALSLNRPNRVMRYVGNLPEKEKKLRELKQVSIPVPEPRGVQSIMPSVTPMSIMLKRRR